MILRPEREAQCRTFYQERQCQIVAEHSAWSTEFYRSATLYAEFPFWSARSGPESLEYAGEDHRGAALPREQFRRASRVRLSDQVQWIDTPCIVGDEICVQPALSHPHLERPVAFIGGKKAQSPVGAVTGNFHS